jgi:hypothetical protein
MRLGFFGFVDAIRVAILGAFLSAFFFETLIGPLGI